MPRMLARGGPIVLFHYMVHMYRYAVNKSLSFAADFLMNTCSASSQRSDITTEATS